VEDSPSEQETKLFVRCFNRYIQKNGLRCSDKNMVNSRKTKLKWEVGKEKNGPSCFGCGKIGHLKNTKLFYFLKKNYNLFSLYISVK